MEVDSHSFAAARNLEWLFLGTASVALAFGRSWVRVWPFVLVIITGAVINSIFYLIPKKLIKEKRWSKTVYLVHLLSSITIIALACGFSGGLQSPVYPFFFLVVLIPAVVGSLYEVAAVSLFAVAAFFLCGALLTSSGSVPAPQTFIRIALLAIFPPLLNIVLSSYRRTMRDSTTFSTLYRISRSLGESMDLRQVLNHLLVEIDGVFNTDISSIRLLDPGANTLIVKASGAAQPEVLNEQIEIHVGEGFIGWVAKSGEPFLMNDISRHPSFNTFPRAGKKVVSAIATPIKIGDRVVGVISCGSSQQKRFTRNDLELLDAMASLAGGAIERSDLYQQLLSRGKTIIESMVDGLIVVDLEGHTVLTNKTARDMLKVRPGLGEPIEDLMRGRIAEWRRFCSDVRLNVLGSPARAPSAFTADLHSEVDNFVLLAKVSPIKSQWGKIIGSTVLLENISEKTKLAMELDAEKKNFEAVLENIAVGVISINCKGEIIIANSAALHILGIDRPWWWIGAPLEEAIPEPELTRTIREAMERGEEILGETVETGSGRYLAVSCISVPDTAQGTAGTIVLMHDITEIHRLEQARNDFISIASHELRTPLTSIKAYVDTLLRQDVEFPKETRTDFIKVIAKESDRMVNLLNNLRDLSRIESGRLGFNPVLVDLVELIRRVVSHVCSQRTAPRINLHLPDDLKPVHAEASKLEQVMLNLINNAIMYSPGSSEIEIIVKPFEETAMVSVIDSGAGIPEEQLPHVFEKGRSADPSGTRGMGLGLFVAKTIVEAHGGRIWVESKDAKGTNMTFTIPFAVTPKSL